MKDGQNIMETVGATAGQKIAVSAVAATSLGGVVNQFLEIVPGIVALVAAIVSLSVALLMRKKTKKEIELLDIKLEDNRQRRKEDI